MSRLTRQAGPDALDVLEESAHLLRTVPAHVLAVYLAGTVPFLLGLLFFVAEMSRGAYAEQHLAEAALGMVGLFVWMKTAQAVAAGHALAHLEQRPPARPGWRGLFLLAARQLRLHAAGLAALPLAAISVVAFGWVHSWTQNATVLALSEGRGVPRAAWEQARLRPGQNHLVMALLLTLGLIVFVNVAAAIYAVPALLRTLFGWEQVLATTGWNPLNTTFLAAALALTHLVMDPFVKAAAVIRCFHGLSLRSGLDLALQARNALARALPGSAMVLLLALPLLTGGAATARALGAAIENTTPAASSAAGFTTAVTPADLNAAIEQVLERPEYAWRLPRVSDAAEKGVVARFIDAFFDTVRRALRWIGQVVERVFEWLFRRHGAADPGDRGMGPMAGAVNLLLVALVVLLLGGLLWLLWRWWQRSRVAAPAPAAATVAPVPEAEELTADQLPEDEWLRLAREMMARGDRRQGLRALFLGALAALGARGLLVLARHKSNRDYERELARRGDAAGPLAARYAETRRQFEKVWYGWYSPSDDEVRRFESEVGHLRGGEG